MEVAKCPKAGSIKIGDLVVPQIQDLQALSKVLIFLWKGKGFQMVGTNVQHQKISELPDAGGKLAK